MLSIVAKADYRKARLAAPPQGVAATGGASSEFTETGAEGKIPVVDRVDAVSMGEVSEAP